MSQNNDYRNEAREIAKESRWTFFRFLPLVFTAVVILAAVSFGLRSLGLIGGTIVERKVFEESYQRSESLSAAISHEESVLTEIEQQLANPNLDENTRYNLKAQASAARIRISTARSKQK